MHALIRDGQVIETRTLPALWRDEGGAWWDFREGQRDPADAGWLEVARTPRPTDDTHAYEWSIELIDGQPVETWTPRQWTPAEQADRAEQAARFDSIEDRLARIEAHLWPPRGPRRRRARHRPHDDRLRRHLARHNQAWRSTVDANVWEPGNYGWTPITQE